MKKAISVQASPTTYLILTGLIAVTLIGLWIDNAKTNRLEDLSATIFSDILSK